MNNNKKALLLIGSPKGDKSTSASLGNYLISKLEESGMTTEKAFIHRIVNREEKIKGLFESIDNANLIILSFPLYVDSLPAPAIKAMELIHQERNKSERKSTQNFIAICNNGFPEASQNTTALQICRIFSQDCGFIWKGGIAIGGGGAINGIPLQERGGMVRNVIKGLEIAANALKDGEEIPQDAINLMSKKFIPYSIYRTFGNLGWRLQIRRNTHRKRIRTAKSRYPFLITVLTIIGLILLILGIPIMIFGIINEDPFGLTLGITFSIIGLNLFLFGLIFLIVLKKKKNSLGDLKL